MSQMHRFDDVVLSEAALNLLASLPRDLEPLNGFERRSLGKLVRDGLAEEEVTQAVLTDLGRPIARKWRLRPGREPSETAAVAPSAPAATRRELCEAVALDFAATLRALKERLEAKHAKTVAALDELIDSFGSERSL